MANLAKYIVQLEAQTAQYRRDLDRANKRLDRFHRHQQRRLQSLTRAWRRFAPAVTTLVTGGILARMVRQSIDQADALAKLTDRLGGTTEAYSELAFVAERSGLQFRTLELGLQRMQRRVSEAANGFGEAKGALMELGLEAAEITRLPIDQQFEVVADALAGVESEATRTRLAMKLFDSEGVALLQTMKDGARGIRELRARARELGITLSSEQAQAAVEAKDAITDLNTSWAALVQTLATRAAPALAETADSLRRLLGGFSDQENIDLFQQQLDNLLASGLTLDDAAVRNTIDALNQALAGQTRNQQLSLFQEIQPRALQSLEQTRALLYGQADAWDEVNRAIRDYEVALTGADALDTFQAASKELDEYLEAVAEAERRQANLVAGRARRTFDQASDDLREFIRLEDQAADQARQLGLTFTSAFEDAIVNGERLSNVLDGILRDLIRITARKLFTEPAADFIGGLISGSRASGGPVSAGGTYLVGERGPELFTPQASGYITPNNALGGGPSISYTIDARGADEATIMQKMVPLLERTVQISRESVRKDLREGRFV